MRDIKPLARECNGFLTLLQTCISYWGKGELWLPLPLLPTCVSYCGKGRPWLPVAAPRARCKGPGPVGKPVGRLGLRSGSMEADCWAPATCATDACGAGPPSIDAPPYCGEN